MSEDYWRGALYVYRASVAQANGAGGAIVLDVDAGDGNEFLVMAALASNSGTNDIQMLRVDEDNNTGVFFASVSSAATTQCAIPQSLAGTASDGTIIDSTDPWTRVFAGAGDKFTVRQNGAGAQNDTLILQMWLRLATGIPTVEKGRSTNAGDVTIATPTVAKVM